MIHEHPRAVILIGFLLVSLGVVLPLLMVLQIVKATFLLSFISYGGSVAGLLLGVVGAASYIKVKKSQLKKDE